MRKSTRYSEGYRPVRGCLHLTYNENIPAILALLPGKAEVSFQVALDNHTSPPLVHADTGSDYDSRVEHGLHGDALFLVAWFKVRGKLVERRFEVQAQTSAHNSARFGNPRHERDTVGNPDH